MTVEEQLVLAADKPAESDRDAIFAGSLGEHALALGALAGVVGGCGDVDDQPRAVGRLLGGRGAGQPDVLTDRQPDQPPADLDRRSRGSRLEVAPLVEHAVVGQMNLAVDRLDRAVGEHGGGIVDVLGVLREADDRDHAVRLCGQI